MILDNILKKCKEEKNLSKSEIKFLLEQSDENNVEKIFAAARDIRNKYFNSKVFLYGFIFFSTFCKNDCHFCYYRKSNDKPPRYRKSISEIIETARELKDSGVHLIDLTMGEDSYYSENSKKLAEIVDKVKKETNLPLMISPGVVKDSVIDELIAAGADWYALYQETHNRNLFKKLRFNQDYNVRFHAKEYAKNKGMLIEEGLLVGAGNNVSDTIKSFEAMKNLKASQIRAMTFIPQEGTPMEGRNQPGFLNELLAISVMRLVFPKTLIPASLDVDGLNGLEERLNAGANVVTSIIPPKKGYAGVANASCDINEGFRTVAGIQETLGKCGLKNAAAGEYKDWLKIQKDQYGISVGNAFGKKYGLKLA